MAHAGSVCGHRGAVARVVLTEPADPVVVVERNRSAADAIAAAKAALSADALELHVADARAFVAREKRRFDAIFLDPPFQDDPWDWLLPACVDRLEPRGFVYAEAGRAIRPPPELVTWRSDRAGQVHYHLFAPSRPDA